jgi:3',5'-cyclic AMP phosphodiesterase CpdA
MRIIAHISDLHFGREDKEVLEALLADLSLFSLSLVVVSGDLTQRARREEFIAAKAFLNRLPTGYLVVPGNHDIPLYNLLNRLSNPLERYRQYITDDLSPTYQDNEIVVLGANTARSLTWKNGSLSNEQIFHLSSKLREIPESIFKVVVTHHQFLPQPGKRLQSVVKRAPLALQKLESVGVDLILAGHLHIGYQDDARAHHPISKSIIVAQAGTAISTRQRGETNSYNLIILEKDSVSIMVRYWDGKTFKESYANTYIRKNLFWQKTFF